MTKKEATAEEKGEIKAALKNIATRFISNPSFEATERARDEAKFGKPVIEQCSYKEGEGIDAFTTRLCEIFSREEQAAFIRGFSQLVLVGRVGLRAHQAYLNGEHVSNTMAAFFPPADHQHLVNSGENPSGGDERMNMSNDKASALIVACNLAVFHLSQINSRIAGEATKQGKGVSRADGLPIDGEAIDAFERVSHSANEPINPYDLWVERVTASADWRI